MLLWNAIDDTHGLLFRSGRSANNLEKRGTDSAAVEQKCGELVQHGLNELLLSPAVKRRAGIEFKRAFDVDAAAAVSMVGKYKQQVFDVGVIACGRVSIQRGVLPVRATASDSSLIVPLSR
jgi:hypothetical protein